MVEAVVRHMLKAIVPARARSTMREARQRLLMRSLRYAALEQDLEPLMQDLERICPRLDDQYTASQLDSDYYRLKVRMQQAFQVALARSVVASLEEGVIADLGDSAGTHVEYLKVLIPGPRRTYLSVNIDEQAVHRIRQRGHEAVAGRLEDLNELGVQADIYLCFEVLEHLQDPVGVLHRLAQQERVRALVATVPYVSRSRIGLHHIRLGERQPVSPEDVHVLELSPGDWRLVFNHSGWRVQSERVYRQYPQRSVLRCTQSLWRSLDYEGFYGVVLERDDSWSALYQGWSEGWHDTRDA